MTEIIEIAANITLLITIVLGAGLGLWAVGWAWDKALYYVVGHTRVYALFVEFAREKGRKKREQERVVRK